MYFAPLFFLYHGVFDSSFSEGNSIEWPNLSEMNVPCWEIHEDL